MEAFHLVKSTVNIIKEILVIGRGRDEFLIVLFGVRERECAGGDEATSET